jgi:activating signal cointegrator 1
MRIGETMKALTLWQPWAGAMALGIKTIETRGRRFNYRGDLCIHSAMRTIPWEEYPQPAKALGYPPDKAFWHGGAILCVVEVYDCISTEIINRAVEEGAHLTEAERLLGDYSPRRFGILTRNLRVLNHPVPCRGHQATPWTVPQDIEAKVAWQVP